MVLEEKKKGGSSSGTLDLTFQLEVVGASPKTLEFEVTADPNPSLSNPPKIPSWVPLFLPKSTSEYVRETSANAEEFQSLEGTESRYFRDQHKLLPTLKESQAFWQRNLSYFTEDHSSNLGFLSLEPSTSQTTLGKFFCCILR